MTEQTEYIASLEVMSEEELEASLKAGARLHKLRVTGKAQVQVEGNREFVRCAAGIRDDRGRDGCLSACLALDAEGA